MLVSSFLVFAAMSGCPLSTHVICPACIDHERDNSRCEWIGDTPFLLEPGNPAHQRHLVHDAQLAEGLAVRFAGAEHKRLYGIEHHGGLIDNGRVVRECMSRMFSRIALLHRRVPWNVTLGAATLSGSILAAMFARTFATSATGYFVVSLALLALVFALGLVGRVGAESDARREY